MRDARGFEPQPGREMSDEDLGLANVILPNGARYYVDHAHPEYSTPECLTPRDLVIHDKAGERILERSLDVLAADMPQTPAPGDLQEQLRRQGQLLRHARELPRRPRDALRRHRARPDAVLRDAAGLHRRGQGRVRGRPGTTAPRPGTSSPHARTSSRPRWGSRRRLKRPIINTRDEPHADPEKYRRLHVHRRRREPVRGGAVPQDGHDGDRAQDDRGRLPARLLARSSRWRRSTRSRATSTSPPRSSCTDGRRMTAVQLQMRVPGARAEVRRPRGRHARQPRGASRGGRRCRRA